MQDRHFENPGPRTSLCAACAPSCESAGTMSSGVAPCEDAVPIRCLKLTMAARWY